MKISTAWVLLPSTLTAALPTQAGVDTGTTMTSSPIYEAYGDAFSQVNSRQVGPGPDTWNDLVGGGCIIIFARDTAEPGDTGVSPGPPFFDAIEMVNPGRALVQGVNDYPADVVGYLSGGSRTGANNMAYLASQRPQILM